MNATGQTSDVATVHLTVTPSPEGINLAANPVSASMPASAIGGQKVHGRVYARIDNLGTVGVSQRVSISLYASLDDQLDTNGDTLIAQIMPKEKIGIGQGKIVGLKIKCLPTISAGTYHLLAKVDSAEAIAETNENDNVAIFADPIVVAAPQVDLAGAFESVSSHAGKLSAQYGVTNGGNVQAVGKTSIVLSARPLAGAPTCRWCPSPCAFRPGAGAAGPAGSTSAFLIRWRREATFSLQLPINRV